MSAWSKLASRFASGRAPQLKRVYVAGAAANANLAVAGIKKGVDQLVSVAEHSDAAAPVDRTGVATIFADGVVRVNDDTAGNVVEVLFWKVAK